MGGRVLTMDDVLQFYARHICASGTHEGGEDASPRVPQPRLTKMWTHLERQSGRGGWEVGLRGPRKTQLEAGVDIQVERGHRGCLQRQLCLRPAVSRQASPAGVSGEEAADKRIPKFVRLLPDKVARICAYETFLGGALPRSSTSSSAL